MGWKFENGNGEGRPRRRPVVPEDLPSSYIDDILEEYANAPSHHELFQPAAPREGPSPDDRPFHVEYHQDMAVSRDPDTGNYRLMDVVVAETEIGPGAINYDAFRRATQDSVVSGLAVPPDQFVGYIDGPIAICGDISPSSTECHPIFVCDSCGHQETIMLSVFRVGPDTSFECECGGTAYPVYVDDGDGDAPTESIMDLPGRVVHVDRDYAIQDEDRLVVVNSSGRPVTITLPDPALNVGREIVVKRVDDPPFSANDIRIVGRGQPWTLSGNYNSIALMSDGVVFDIH